jgi:hypothetical protein
MNQNIKKTLDRVQTSARQGLSPETRIVREDMIPYGKVIRQGDVYLRRLPIDEHVRHAGPAKTRQLAPGTSTGSRHVVTEDRGAQVLDRQDPGPLDGPLVLAPSGFYLSHPKHADIDCRAPGCYEVTFPVDKHAEELGEIRRLAD